MQLRTFVQDFTGIYQEQPFMQGLRKSECAYGETHAHWLDCSQISGTDCYCDNEAIVVINRIMDDACAVGCESAIGLDKLDIHFFDNGNYHYMSKLWTDRVLEPFDLVVFDHHPDMQPPRFEGILSCGGWVKEVLDDNKFVRNVMLVGVADHLIEEIQNEPSVEFEKYKNRVTFVPESMVQNAVLSSESGADVAIQAFAKHDVSRALYISIDKDVLCKQDVVTNWDQGCITFSQMAGMLETLFKSRKVLGVDICGERALNQDYEDGMDESSADKLNNALNEKLYGLLNGF